MPELLWILIILLTLYIVVGVGFSLAATWFLNGFFGIGERVTLKELIKFSLLWPKFFIGK